MFLFCSFYINTCVNIFCIIKASEAVETRVKYNTHLSIHRKKSLLPAAAARYPARMPCSQFFLYRRRSYMSAPASVLVAVCKYEGIQLFVFSCEYAALSLTRCVQFELCWLCIISFSSREEECFAPPGAQSRNSLNFLFLFFFNQTRALISQLNP